MMVKSKIIIAVVSITLISVILLGCLNKGVAEVKPEQIQINDFKWTEIQGSSSLYEIIINSDYDGEVEVSEIYFGNKKMPSGFSSRLIKGENIIRGDYRDYNPTTKEREQLLIKVKSSYDQVPVTISKVIDMPYLSVEVIPSSTLIHREGDYLTLINKGNTKGQFLVKNKDFFMNEKGLLEMKCGISTEYDYKTYTIGSQESIKIPFRIVTNVGNCLLEKGATGSDVIQVIFIYSKQIDEATRKLENQEIIMNEIRLNYIN